MCPLKTWSSLALSSLGCCLAHNCNSKHLKTGNRLFSTKYCINRNTIFGKVREIRERLVKKIICVTDRIGKWRVAATNAGVQAKEALRPTLHYPTLWPTLHCGPPYTTLHCGPPCIVAHPALQPTLHCGPPYTTLHCVPPCTEAHPTLRPTLHCSPPYIVAHSALRPTLHYG